MKAKPKKAKRVQPPYRYSARGLIKLSVPVDAATDGRLTKLAASWRVSKASMARDLLVDALTERKYL